MEYQYEVSRDLDLNPVIFPTYGCIPHYHTHVELICVISGKIEVVINGDRRELSAGDVGFSGSLDIHSYSLLTPDADSLVLIVPTKYLGRFETFTGKRTIDNHFFSGRGFDDILPLLQIGKRYISGNDLVISGIIDSVLGIAAQNLTFFKDEKPKVDMEVMRKALTYICENYESDITLSLLADKYGYSPNYFSKLFNTYFQRGLKEYLNSVRADHAVELIMNGADVNEAAYSSGFDCMRTFYRAFKERFSMTPQEYVAAKKLRLTEKS